MKNLTFTIVCFLLSCMYCSAQINVDFGADYITHNNCPPATVNFVDVSTSTQGAIISWEWDLGDGTLSNEENPTHIYDLPGDYTICLTVSDGMSSNSLCKDAYILIGDGSFTLSCLDDIELSCTESLETIPEPFVSNACSDVTISYNDVVFNLFCESIDIERTWTAIDADGNIATCIQ